MKIINMSQIKKDKKLAKVFKIQKIYLSLWNKIAEFKTADSRTDQKIITRIYHNTGEGWMKRQKIHGAYWKRKCKNSRNQSCNQTTSKGWR
jgi:hypothetical protein